MLAECRWPAAADHEARAAILGRQKMRAELAAAMAKGYLTRMDQFHLLLHAKEVLSAEDLQGFERTLDRIATRQAATKAASASVQSGTVSGPAQDDDSLQTVTPSNYVETTDRPRAKLLESSETATATAGTPRMEEEPSATDGRRRWDRLTETTRTSADATTSAAPSGNG